MVFVEIRTPEISNGRKNKPTISDEKVRINQYLGQAYIKLSGTSNIVELDLSADANFIHYVNSGKIDKEKVHNGKSLIRYLTDKLKDTYPDLYNRHFKAFYFAEDGYKSDGSNISGYSSGGANYVVVFKSKNDQTAAHEFLHAMRLPHTFTNKEATSDAQYTYIFAKTDNLLDYSHHPNNNSKRCSLYYWQWKQANNSVR